jgi:hypothetical protein
MGAAAAAGNVYRHEYEAVDETLIWHTVRHDLAALRSLANEEFLRLQTAVRPNNGNRRDLPRARRRTITGKAGSADTLRSRKTATDVAAQPIGVHRAAAVISFA